MTVEEIANINQSGQIYSIQKETHNLIFGDNYDLLFYGCLHPSCKRELLDSEVLAMTYSHADPFIHGQTIVLPVIVNLLIKGD